MDSYETSYKEKITEELRTLVDKYKLTPFVKVVLVPNMGECWEKELLLS